MFVRNVDQCPECGSEQIRIYDKRLKWGRVVRYRECMTCRCHYKTIEIDFDLIDPNATHCRDFLYDMLNAGYSARVIVESLSAALERYEGELEKRKKAEMDKALSGKIETK